MGFQTGTTIRPELGNADFSGFANAASITANAYAKLGDQIGAGIEKYNKKKQDAADDEAFAQAVEPYLMDIAGGDADEAKKLGKFLRKDPGAFNAIQALRQDKADKKAAEMTREILQNVGAGNISAQEAFAMGVSPEAIKAYTGVTEGQDAKKFNESVTLAAESVGGTYDPKQNAIVVDKNGVLPGGKTVIAISDPRFANFFATAKGQNMTGRGLEVLGTNNSTSNPVVSSTPPSAPVVMESPSRPGIGSALMEIVKTPGRLDPTDVDISTEIPTEYIEPSLDFSEVTSGAVSRMSDFFKRKLQENESIRQATYGR